MDKKSDKVVAVVTILFFVIIGVFTIGYAFNDKVITLTGEVTAYRPGKIEFLSSTYDSSHSSMPKTFGKGLYIDNNIITMDFQFTVNKEEKDYYATYIIEIFNDTHNDFVFSGFNILPVINFNGAGEDSNSHAIVTYEYATNAAADLNIGDTIKAGETRKLAIKLNFDVASENSGMVIKVDGDADVYTSEDNSGSLYGALLNDSVDLRGEGTIDCFDVTITNTFKTQKTFTLASSKRNYIMVDSSGNAIPSLNIPASTEENPDLGTQTYNVCIKTADGSLFVNENDVTSIVISSADTASFSIGTLNIQVDLSEEKDTEPPKISNVTFSPIKYNPSDSSLSTRVTWVEEDVSTIDSYTIQLYDSDTGTPVETFTAPGTAITSNYELVLDSSFLQSNNSAIVTNNHSFYVKIYGVDASGNSGASFCSVTSSEYCGQSSSTSLKYKFNITISDNSNVYTIQFANSSTTVYLNVPFSDVVRVTSDSYTLDSTLTITMGGEAFTNYMFSLNSGSSTEGTLNIPENVINNDISVVASATYSGGGCLVEGTLIKTFTGYKKVEDIRYDDLLSVYSYELGKEVYEYPIAITKGTKIDSYKRVHFSDGTHLDLFFDHGLYSADDNKYVSINDKDSFHVGTRIVKIKNSQKVIVKVTDIETIKEESKFYNITSTRYLNVLANDVLTTDYLLPVSNIYEFDNNIKWTKERDIFLASNQLFKYEELSKYFPKYIFYGIRLDEAKFILMKYPNTLEFFITQYNIHNFEKPILNKNNDTMWMVTTSDDLKLGIKGNLYQEGFYYVLKRPLNSNKFVGWYNTANGRMYNPGDKVEIKFGTYFEAIYK